MVFATHQFGAGTFSPPAPETRPFVPTAEGVQANFEAWMEKTGHRLAEEQRKQPPRASWASLLGVPDRTVRIESLIPIGNQVLIELISSWTEDGVLKETAWVVVALYDTDGTVLQDRSYIDLLNWPSARRYAQQRQGTPSGRPPIVGQGVMDKFYAYHRSRQIDGAALTDMEKRNLATIQGPWLDAYNTDLDTKPFHAPRFRLQLPCQKCSCNLIVATEVETIIRRAAPDRKMRLGMTYARGNQAVAEGIVSWTEDGVARESPFISFFVLDAEGKIIRDRRYITMANWPGADSMAARLGL
jgi:hypothetical protein